MIVVGTAGHIDHGKTTMIRSLTGIETDRLKEEQQRGISIELGFAYLDLPDSTRVGLIDVPGHERFVHHMIAGATGVDLVLLVVAADEGVMPQTKEHIAICELLGMKAGIVVVTKTDLVDDEWLELVKDDVQDYLKNSFLADAPILEFSSTWQAEPLDTFKRELYGHISSIASSLEKATLHRPLMMPVDRVFSIKGFGTVVTGTVGSGTLRAGDTVAILPSGALTKIRRLENHGQPAQESRAGVRTAANIPDVQTGQVQRGNVLVAPGTVEPVVQASAVLHTVDNLQIELKNQFKALFHTGSALVETSVRLLDSDNITGGEMALVALRFSVPVPVLPGSRFVLRGFSMVADYGKTLGGGTILWPGSVKARPTNLEMLGNLISGSPDEILASLAYLGGLAGVAASRFNFLSPLPTGVLARQLENADGNPVHLLLAGGQPLAMHDEFFAQYSRRILDIVKGHHEKFPRQRGIRKEELKTRLPSFLLRDLVLSSIEYMTVAGQLDGDEMLTWVAGWEPQLDQQFVELLDRVRATLSLGGMTPPLRDAIGDEIGLDEREMTEALAFLVEAGDAVRVSSDLYMHAATVAGAQSKLVSFLTENGDVTTQQLKDLFGISRKYLIPLGEYFDAAKVTVRFGASQRRLRKQ